MRRIGDRPMTALERKRRQRELDQAAAAYLARPATGSTSRRCRDAHEQTNGFIREAVSFLVDYGKRLPVWLKGTKLSREDKDALVRTLHQVANELTLLAQKVDGVAAVGPHRMRGSGVRRREKNALK
jgi:hypothetical protein